MAYSYSARWKFVGYLAFRSFTVGIRLALVFIFVENDVISSGRSVVARLPGAGAVAGRHSGGRSGGGGGGAGGGTDELNVGREAAVPAVVARLELDNELIAGRGEAPAQKLRVASLLVVHVLIAAVAQGYVVPGAVAVRAVQHLHVGDEDLDPLAGGRVDDPPADDVGGEVVGVLGRGDGSRLGDVQVTAVEARVAVAAQSLAGAAGGVGRTDTRAVLADEAAVLAGGRAGAAGAAVQLYMFCFFFLTGYASSAVWILRGWVLGGWNVEC